MRITLRPEESPSSRRFFAGEDSSESRDQRNRASEPPNVSALIDQLAKECGLSQRQRKVVNEYCDSRSRSQNTWMYVSHRGSVAGRTSSLIISPPSITPLVPMRKWPDVGGKCVIRKLFRLERGLRARFVPDASNTELQISIHRGNQGELSQSSRRLRVRLKYCLRNRRGRGDRVVRSSLKAG